MLYIHIWKVFFPHIPEKIGILLPKLFWPIVWKNCSRDREKLMKFEAEGWEFAKFLRSLEQFIQTEKSQNNFPYRMLFRLVPGGFLHII